MHSRVIPIGPDAYMALYRGERVAVGDTAAEALAAGHLVVGRHHFVGVIAVSREWNPDVLIRSVYPVMTSDDAMLLMSDTVVTALREGRVRDALALLPDPNQSDAKVLNLDAWRHGNRRAANARPAGATSSPSAATVIGAIHKSWADWRFVNHIVDEASPADVSFLHAD